MNDFVISAPATARVPCFDQLALSAVKGRRQGWGCPIARPVSVLGHHVKRFEVVLDYIEENLSEELSLDVLANCAAISPFHFHRLFHAWCGETLSSFVRRRRVERAAGRLRYCPAEKITYIALSCGFSSPETFARAFREHFGMSPSQWRAGGWVNWSGQAVHSLAPSHACVTVTQEEEAEYLFMRARGDYAVAANELWARFLPMVNSLGLGKQPLVFIGLDDPEITAASMCRMDACVELPRGWTVPGAAPSLRHRFGPRWIASLPFRAAPELISQGWRHILEEWLPHAPFELGEGHFFMRYDPQVCFPGSAHLSCELCVPVRPRASW